MDENNEIENLQSYYEITYLDDANTLHFGKVKGIDELNFMKNRFDVKNYNLVTNN